MKNFNEIPSDNTIRHDVFRLVFDYLVTIYGAEKVSQVGNSEMSIGITTADNGNEIAVNLAPVVKTYIPTEDFPAYNRIEEATIYDIITRARKEERITKKKNKLAKLKAEIEKLELELNE